MSNITQETIDLAKSALQQPLAKDATTQGYTTATGITGYNLEAPAKSLFPVLAPFRNLVPRTKSTKGAPAAHWKAITAINATNQRATTSFGSAGNLVSTSEQDFVAAYKVIALGDTVQYDAEIQAQGFQDLRATAGVNLLYSLMQQEDIIMLGGQNFALNTPSAPTLTPASTGGSIGAVNVGVAVATRTMQGWFDGQGGIASTAATTGALTGTTNKVTATVAAVAGGVVYDWYVGTAGGTLYYYGSSTSPTIVITSVPTSANAAGDGSGVVNQTLALLAAPQATTAAAANADKTADANAYNGLIASLAGNYSGGAFVANGAGTPTGAYYKNLNGAALTGNVGTIAEIDAALLSIWQTTKQSPTKIMVNAIDHVNMSNKIINSGGAYTLFRPDNVGERQNVVGGQLVDTYLNKAVNGHPIPIETHPWLPQGTIIILTEKLTFPNNKVSNVLEFEALQEYQQIEYAVNRTVGSATGGPRYDFEVRCQGVFKNYFPGAMAIIQGVANA